MVHPRRGGRGGGSPATADPASSHYARRWLARGVVKKGPADTPRGPEECGGRAGEAGEH